MDPVDLSHAIESGMPVYPDSPPVAVETRDTVVDDGARVTDLQFDTHAGTHVDAPAHTEPGGESIDDLDLSAFVFEARVVDCSGLDDREPVAVADLAGAVEGHSGASELDALLFHTGWDDHWGTERYRDHPFLSPDAARWCACRGYSVGLDTFGPDPTPSADPIREGAAEPGGLPAHHALLGVGCRIVENLTGLGSLPEQVTLRAYPLRIADGDASPVRAVAEPR